MDVSSRRRRRLIVTVALIAFAVWLVFKLQHGRLDRERSPHITEQDARKPLIPSPYHNTASGVEYVGSRACADCHATEFAGFTNTPHHLTLERINVAEEPPDGQFVHEKSGHTYRVYRQGGQLWHREAVEDGRGNELILGDYPMAFRIGSGNHSRSYLVEVDGFLLESPVTWYTSKAGWAISPGYDAPVHDGFTRPAHEGCVHCHSGRVESVDHSTHRLRFAEQSIGCESCHGPGSLHVAARSRGAHVSGDIDDTIVHPAKLPRELNESICARCHLRGLGVAPVRGRHRNDFRPGLPLTAFRVDYAAKQTDRSMKVVGHFEQMHQSQCYSKSETLTCTTCHNPHVTPTESKKTEYYRQKCLSCHAPDDADCRLPLEDRLRENSQDDCVACHMPKADTEIPHFAFTHHRIGLGHTTGFEEPEISADVELIPLGDVSRLPSADRERCLGLAYLHLGDKSSGKSRNTALSKAFSSLKRAYADGVRDARVLSSLAYLHWLEGSKTCERFAEQAVHLPDCDPESRLNALIVLGDTRLNAGNPRGAETMFRELTQLRLRYVDWQMRGVCRAQVADTEQAISAYTQALRLRPDAIDVHLLLANELAKSGNHAKAQEHRDIGHWLQNLRRHRQSQR